MAFGAYLIDSARIGEREEILSLLWILVFMNACAIAVNWYGAIGGAVIAVSWVLIDGYVIKTPTKDRQ